MAKNQRWSGSTLPLALSVMSALALACGPSPSSEPAVEQKPEVEAEPVKPLPAYEIIGNEKRPPYKRVVDVRLQAPLDEADLTRLAQTIKAGDRGNYNNTFITYLLPDMELGQGAWATTHYNPDLRVLIFGPTASEIEAWGPVPERDGAELVGAWIEYGFGARYMLYKTGSSYTLATVYKDGSGGDTAYRGKQTKAGLKLTLTEGQNSAGDYYLVLPDGSFQSADNEGVISTHSPVQE